jgi:hypothetical protein
MSLIYLVLMKVVKVKWRQGISALLACVLSSYVLLSVYGWLGIRMGDLVFRTPIFRINKFTQQCEVVHRHNGTSYWYENIIYAARCEPIYDR